jgi:outer membrane protein assembly factor BamB
MWSPRTNRPGGRATALAAGFVAVLVAVPSGAQPRQAAPPASAVTPGLAPAPRVFPLGVAWILPLEEASDTTVELSARGLACPPAYDVWSMYVALKTGRLSAVSLGTGTARWTVKAADVRAVTATDGLVLTVAGDLVTARRGADGVVAWELRLDVNASAALCAEHGWVIAATEGGDVLGIRAREGTKVWQVKAGARLAGVPAIAGDGLYLPLENNQVRRLDILTGRTVWQRTLVARPRTILALEDRLFVGTVGRYLYALEPNDAGRVRWRIHSPEVTGAPAAGERMVYYLSLDNVLRAIDRVNGTLKWQQVLGYRALYGPVPAGPLLLVAGTSNAVSAWTATLGTEAGVFEAPHELAAPLHVIPGLVDRDLLIVGISPEGTVLAIRPDSLAPEPFVAAAQWPAGMPVLWRWK